MSKLHYLAFLSNDEIPEFNKIVSNESQLTMCSHGLSAQWFYITLSPEESTIIKLKFRYVERDTHQRNVTAYSE